MGKLLSYRDAVVAAIAAGIPEFNTVRASAGVFSSETLQAYTQRTPCAAVSLIQARNITRDNLGRMIGPVMTVIYVIDKDPRKGASWGPAIELADKVADFVELNQFGLDYVAAARVRDVDVLYSMAMDKLGVCLAAVTMMQEVAWGRDRNVEDELAQYPGWTDEDTMATGWGTVVTPQSDVDIGSTTPTYQAHIGFRQVHPPPLEPEPPKRVEVEIIEEDEGKKDG